MQENGRDEAKPQEDQSPHDRRNEKFDEPRVRREAGIIGMTPRKNERLHDDRNRHRGAAMAIALPDQRRQRKRDGAKQAFLHESRL